MASPDADSPEPAPPARKKSSHLFSTSRPVEWALRSLLVFIPASLVAEVLHADPTLVFVMSAIAIVSLSALLGRSTEEYAVHVGPALGGLLNATLGNAVELIIAAFAVAAGLFEIVKASLTGSIVANLLLVLGMSMLAGGMKHSSQRLHRRGTMTSLSLMTLSVIALSLPALFFYSSLSPNITGVPPPPGNPHEDPRLLMLSLVVGAVMISVYALGLLYSLVTHRHLFHEEIAEEEAEWSKKRCLTTMALATGGVALMAEALVGSVAELTSRLGLTQLFVGVVIVAIVGNAAEHSTAIIVAMRNKMDLAFQIAAGSSAQIALFVAPVLIFLSFALGRPMDLVFEIFELFSIAIAVAVTYAVSIDEETNWFEGALLLGVYIIICAVFYFHP